MAQLARKALFPRMVLQRQQLKKKFDRIVKNKQGIYVTYYTAEIIHLIAN